MRRFARTAVLTGALLLALSGTATAADTGTVSITGAVASPASYTAAQLAALPQTGYPITNPGHGPRTVTGTDLDDLVTAATPNLPPGKNTALRVSLTVTGKHHRSVTFALGELTPDFGNHPAVLTTAGREIELVVPGDRTRTRSISGLTAIRVAVSTAGADAVAPGSIRVIGPHRTVTLSAALLSRLPARRVTSTFLAGTTPQTHTESGPPLSLVLLAAGILPLPDTTVVAIGGDGYGAAVTLAETYVGGRELLVSTVKDGVPLTQPRLVPNGDVKGGRYVSGVVTLAVG
ncbi:hypothetical protein [Amycolatopsis sp.]|jgi:hypothetical protein|uniref:hypothetical protein n=1 Tax=Amycolatopsis sp. TaxID=37632 RepID=UPI002DF9C583|nr:hypothetical protein [Amycolatopsis sp.]